MNYIWRFHHFFGSLNSRSFSTGFQLLTMLGGYVQISDNKSAKLKKSLFSYFFYKCMSLYSTLLNRSVSVTLSSLTLPENKKLRNYVTVKRKKNSYGGRYWHFLCKIWSNPPKNEPNRCPSSYHRRVLLSRNTTKTLFKIWWLFDTGFHIIWWEDFIIMTLFTP